MLIEERAIMNKIICDNQECKAEIKPMIEAKFLSNGVKINFFRCQNCRAKYLIDVTDQATREKQIEYRKWSEQRQKALDIVIDGMNEEELDKLTLLLDETAFNMDRLQEEIKAAKAELKIKYEGEL